MKSKLLLIFPLIITGMHAQLKPLTYNDGSQKLQGLITANVQKNQSAVLILPAWMGIDDEAKQAALDLEKQGYAAFIADIYGEGNLPTNAKEAAAIATFYKTDYQAYQHRIKLALEALIATGVNRDKIAVIGYCFGGTGALEAARAPLHVSGVVCIHGGLAKDAKRSNGPIATKVLVEHPAADASVSAADLNQLLEEMNQGKADWQLITYAQAKHTFTNPKSADYNEVMAKRAWQHTLLFLKEIL
ncbi:dienelactone hydrolase family protein [Flavobacterium sp. JP2137]|uniref:dienelactone hydrolase family protein n=1 Tax=Flavobacterium sp. JP2137 TaxID=3414510 RepID=UPI003D2FA6BC